MDHGAFTETRQHIEAAYSDRSLLDQAATKDAVKSVIDAVDRGVLRVCDKVDGDWVTHAWVKQAILLYFVVAEMEVMEMGPYHES